MKFAYIAAALLPLAYANVAFQAPEEDSLNFLDAREEDVFDIEERDGDDMIKSFENIFNEIAERFSDFDEDTPDEIDDVIEARSVSSVLKALKSVDKGIKKVQSKLNAFGASQAPSAKQAVAVSQAGNQLAQKVNAAIKKTNASSKPSASGAKKIFKYVKGTLAKDTISSLNAFQKHAAGFKKGGFSGTVKTKLQQLQGLTAQLGKALLSKAPGSLKKSGAKVNKQIQNKFQQTIAKY